MSDRTEIRILLPVELHTHWKSAAALRNLSVTAFISAVVSAELLRTGELPISTKTPAPLEPKPKPKPKPDSELTYEEQIDRMHKQMKASPLPTSSRPPEVDPVWFDDDEE